MFSLAKIKFMNDGIIDIYIYLYFGYISFKYRQQILFRNMSLWKLFKNFSTTSNLLLNYSKRSILFKKHTK